MKQNPVRSLSRPSFVGFAKHQALTTRQQRHRHEFVRRSWKAKKAFQPEKSRKILRRGCCWGFSSSAPPDSSRPPPSSSSPLEASASPPPPRTQAGRPGNRWKCNPNISTAGCFYVTKYLNWLFCYLEGKFEIITRHLVIGGRRQGGSRPTRQRDFETGGQGDPLFENCVVAELKGDLNYFLYLGLKTEWSKL